jgi:nucleoside-diphosphate-sugar epimerase
MSTVLVTGGSGFVGGRIIHDLLAQGEQVRATIRQLSREAEVRAALEKAGAVTADRLSFVAADLSQDDGWREAAAGCDYVLHVASPFPPTAPKHEDDLIVPARDGALRVLRAARDAGVKRVVMTSSFAAVGYGHAEPVALLRETDWTNPQQPGLGAYTKSKTLAERAAWDFIAKEAGSLELSVVNPVLILGPVVSADYAPSVLVVKRMLDGTLPGCPRLFFGVVDVRDVADLHLRAMRSPAAAGERFLAVAGDFLSMKDISHVLRQHLGAAAKRAPRLELPNWMVRLAALRDPEVRQFVPELGKRKNATSEKAQRLLGWRPRPREEAIVATAESLIQLRLVKS